MKEDKNKGEEPRDSGTRIGARHGEGDTSEKALDYARDIGERGTPEGEGGRELRTKGSGLTAAGRIHPSRRLELRSKGYGIGGGYERPYRREKPKAGDSKTELYGPIPHSGYYGTGTGLRPFKFGQASFNEELAWYQKQYGEETSGFTRKKK